LTEKFQFINELKIKLNINFEFNGVCFEILQKIKDIGFRLKISCIKRKYLLQKCGQNMNFVCISTVCNPEIQSFLGSTRILKSIKIDTFEPLIKQPLEELEEFKASKLPEYDSTIFQQFTDIYCNKITKLSININATDYSSIYTQLSRFKVLESLKLSCFGKVSEINEDFIRIPKTLNRLKHFSTSIYTITEKTAGLKTFNNLENLKKFEITVYYLREEDIKFIEKLNLTKLSIIDGRITNEVLKSLANMPKLLEISLKYGLKFDSRTFCDLIKDSHKLKTILINGEYIYEIIMEALIEKASNDKQTKYRLIANDSSNRKIVANERFPKNLIIEKSNKNRKTTLDSQLRLTKHPVIGSFHFKDFKSLSINY
jgi:hypothetical protein